MSMRIKDIEKQTCLTQHWQSSLSLGHRLERKESLIPVR